MATFAVNGNTYALGNYLAFFPGVNIAGARAAIGNLGITSATAINFGARIPQITDGTSNTMFLGEYLRALGASNDFRGHLWGDQPGYSYIFTANTPNSPLPDFSYPGYCDDQPTLNRPCIDAPGDAHDTSSSSSRSMHTDGVNIALCDGSARFVSNGISITTWQSLATIRGGEIIGSDFQ